MVGTRITILCHQRLCKALHHKRVDAFSKLRNFLSCNCWCCSRPTYSSTVFGETINFSSVTSTPLMPYWLNQNGLGFGFVLQSKCWPSFA